MTSLSVSVLAAAALASLAIAKSVADKARAKLAPVPIRKQRIRRVGAVLAAFAVGSLGTALLMSPT